MRKGRELEIELVRGKKNSKTEIEFWEMKHLGVGEKNTLAINSQMDKLKV